MNWILYFSGAGWKASTIMSWHKENLCPFTFEKRVRSSSATGRTSWLWGESLWTFQNAMSSCVWVLKGSIIRVTLFRFSLLFWISPLTLLPGTRLAGTSSLHQLFRKLIEVQGARVRSKVIVIQGDIAQANLGISEEDTQKLINDVSIVFHSAATVKFDEPLKTSIEFNLLGTRRVIQLCHKMPQLKVRKGFTSLATDGTRDWEWIACPFNICHLTL